MVFESGPAAVGLLIARVLFGGLIAFQGLNHFLDAEGMTGYAEAKGIPAPRLAVLASGAMLALGGLGIVLGAFPVLAAALLVAFFVVVTPGMHDFWAVPEDQQQDQMVHFIKNVELLAASIVFLVLGTQPWGYAVGIGL
jgi:uncharacterized membrane protein YphA (DoxX/SURF4 family)